MSMLWKCIFIMKNVETKWQLSERIIAQDILVDFFLKTDDLSLNHRIEK